MNPTILITGSAKRLGAMLALRCAEAGWNVALHYHRSPEEAEALASQLRAHGVQAHGFACDLADPDAVKHLIPEIVEKMGPLSALVNNASVFLKDSAEHPEHRALHMQVNYHAPLQLLEDFAKQLNIPSPRRGREVADGETVNTLSDGSEASFSILNILDGGFGWSMGPAFHSYTQSRLALWNDIPQLALKYSPTVRINGLAPGHVLAGEQDKAKTADKLRDATPLKRLSNPQEFCDAAMFLLTNPSITGQVLEVNGGLGIRE